MSQVKNKRKIKSMLKINLYRNDQSIQHLSCINTIKTKFNQTINKKSNTTTNPIILIISSIITGRSKSNWRDKLNWKR